MDSCCASCRGLAGGCCGREVGWEMSCCDDNDSEVGSKLAAVSEMNCCGSSEYGSSDSDVDSKAGFGGGSLNVGVD